MDSATVTTFEYTDKLVRASGTIVFNSKYQLDFALDVHRNQILLSGSGYGRLRVQLSDDLFQRSMEQVKLICWDAIQRKVANALQTRIISEHFSSEN